MPSTCTSCTTAAGPTIRVYADTIWGLTRLALTTTQALDLLRTIRAELDKSGVTTD